MENYEELPHSKVLKGTDHFTKSYQIKTTKFPNAKYPLKFRLKFYFLIIEDSYLASSKSLHCCIRSILVKYILLATVNEQNEQWKSKKEPRSRSKRAREEEAVIEVGRLIASFDKGPQDNGPGKSIPNQKIPEALFYWSPLIYVYGEIGHLFA